jgi:hypothetical protein
MIVGVYSGQKKRMCVRDGNVEVSLARKIVYEVYTSIIMD